MVAAAVTTKLQNGEEIIYSTGDVFTISNKSVLGDKNFYITNWGNVIAHDTGGLFGDSKVYTDQSGVKLTLEKSTIFFSNVPQGSLIFNGYLPRDKFFDLYKNINIHKLSILKGDTVSGTPCFLLHNDSYTEIFIKEDCIEFEFGEVPYTRISSYTLEDHIISLNGDFPTKVKEKLESSRLIQLFIPFPQDCEKLIQYIDSTVTIYDFMQATSEMNYAIGTGRIGDTVFTDKEFIFAIAEDNLIIGDEEEFEVVCKYSLVSSQFYYDSEKNMLLAQDEDFKNILVLKLQDKETTDILLDNIQTHSSFLNIGELSGALCGRLFENMEVTLLIDSTDLHVLSSTFQREVSVPQRQLSFFFDHTNAFIMQEEEVVMLSVKNTEILQAALGGLRSLSVDDAKKLSFATPNIPYLFTQDMNCISFSQQPHTESLVIPHHTIADIRVASYGPEDSVFSEIVITEKNGHIHQLNIHNEVIRDLIYQAYYFEKQSHMPQITSDQLFMSYSRQVNDYILYHYFGQFFAIHEGLQQLKERDTDETEKSLEILNYLYHGIQAAKQHLDKAAIYLPSMLEQQENELLLTHGRPSAYIPLKNLQRNLMSITTQVNRTLHEIESSISAVSFALIKREEYDSLYDKRFKEGVFAAATIGLVSLIAPFGLIAAPLMLINTFRSKKEFQERARISKQNEQYRLDFHVSKMEDTFRHFMDTLLPFYVSEVNHSTFQAYKQVHGLYEPIKDQGIVREQLLTRIAHLYTFRQLPIDDAVTMPRKLLLERINQTEEQTVSHVTQFRLEVGAHVEQSV